MKARRWPLDFEKLQRGDIIPAQLIEDISGVTRTDRNYGLHSMRLVEQIRQHFLRDRGDDVTVVSDHDDIRIHTIKEQAAYTRREEIRRRRSYSRNLRSGLSVDLSQLDDQEATEHREWQLRASWRKQQLEKQAPPSLTDGESRTLAKPEDVTYDAWNAWLDVRREKGAGPVTRAVWQKFKAECSKAGWTLQAAVEECALRGWVWFQSNNCEGEA